MVLNNLRQMHLKLVQKINSKAGDLIGNKIADKITKVSKNSQQNNKDIVTTENDKEIPLKRYISPEKRQKIIDNVRLILKYKNGISNIDKFVRQYAKSTI